MSTTKGRKKRKCIHLFFSFKPFSSRSFYQFAKLPELHKCSYFMFLIGLFVCFILFFNAIIYFYSSFLFFNIRFLTQTKSKEIKNIRKKIMKPRWSVYNLFSSCSSCWLLLFVMISILYKANRYPFLLKMRSCCCCCCTVYTLYVVEHNPLHKDFLVDAWFKLYICIIYFVFCVCLMMFEGS